MGSTETSEYPAWWDFSDDGDGDTVAGRFVRAGRGFTQQGERTFVVLDVDGVERTVWLHHDVLRNAFARELHRRTDKQFYEGERIEIRQLGTRESANGRTYMKYQAEFPDGPASSHADIFGPPPEPPAREEPAPGGNGEGAATVAQADDEIPF